jgi:hypothetical protein
MASWLRKPGISPSTWINDQQAMCFARSAPTVGEIHLSFPAFARKFVFYTFVYLFLVGYTAGNTNNNMVADGEGQPDYTPLCMQLFV